MNLTDDLDRLLVCPHDYLDLTSVEGELCCSACGCGYLREGGVVHFVTSEEDRPRNPKVLAANYAAGYPAFLLPMQRSMRDV